MFSLSDNNQSYIIEAFDATSRYLDYFLYCFCYAFVRICLLMPCGHLLGKG